MFKQHTKSHNGCNVNAFPERPVHTKPKIAEVYFDSDGVRMYETVDNRHFIADVVDKIFNPVKSAIKRKGYKGKNPDGTKILFY